MTFYWRVNVLLFTVAICRSTRFFFALISFHKMKQTNHRPAWIKLESIQCEWRIFFFFRRFCFYLSFFFFALFFHIKIQKYRFLLLLYLYNRFLRQNVIGISFMPLKAERRNLFNSSPLIANLLYVCVSGESVYVWRPFLLLLWAYKKKISSFRWFFCLIHSRIIHYYCFWIVEVYWNLAASFVTHTSTTQYKWISWAFDG